jgi:uncharacterized membrane protein
VTREERWPAIALAAAAVVLGLLGWVVADDRLRALAWILAALLAAAGLVTVAWGNATGELRRLLSRDD